MYEHNGSGPRDIKQASMLMAGGKLLGYAAGQQLAKMPKTIIVLFVGLIVLYGLPFILQLFY
ncbi:hypothetical protein K0504_15035 [Neiella marina]|uniref:Uncharacterized protein n=1 Tax=Neiella holothuriorum TaxID=2870530 RepID=A0ABS7EJ28_9GAMM|nr:hypothetical protein [Neiella holothuriorum]MBW8192351.1 hypothetical protein [Neiella holothuriorum]